MCSGKLNAALKKFQSVTALFCKFNLLMKVQNSMHHDVDALSGGFQIDLELWVSILISSFKLVNADYLLTEF